MFDYNMTKDEIMNVLCKMDKDELKLYAREQGIRLYTSVQDKMRIIMCDVIYGRLHHGDAFRAK